MTAPAQTDPAAQLRAAANLLRESALNARRVLPEPWTISRGPTDGGGVIYAENGWIVADRSCDEPDDSVDLPYIALMHPGVGEALADWLDTAAAAYDNGDCSHCHCPHCRDTDCACIAPALAVARALLGGQS